MPTNSNHNINVRVAEPDDLDALAFVWHESAASMDGPPFEMPSLKELRNRIDCELAVDWRLYLAERSHKIIGMLAIKPDEAVLDQLFVLRGEQRSGVGSVLLDSAKRYMEKGFTLRMAAENHRAACFYDRAGLRVVSSGNHPMSGAPVKYYRWDVS